MLATAIKRINTDFSRCFLNSRLEVAVVSEAELKLAMTHTVGGGGGGWLMGGTEEEAEAAEEEGGRLGSEAG